MDPGPGVFQFWAGYRTPVVAGPAGYEYDVVTVTRTSAPLEVMLASDLGGDAVIEHRPVIVTLGRVVDLCGKTTVYSYERSEVIVC